MIALKKETIKIITVFFVKSTKNGESRFVIVADEGFSILPFQIDRLSIIIGLFLLKT